MLSVFNFASQTFLQNDLLIFLTREPGKIVGPIAKILGSLFNLLFNMIYSITQNATLGISIIVFTIVVKLLLTPLTIYQQKGTAKSQKAQPEMQAVQAKYKNKKDTESQRKMQQEMQAINQKYGVNMFAGCLPLLVQMPILYALYYIFQQSHKYIDVIKNFYDQIANIILSSRLEYTLLDIASKRTYFAGLNISQKEGLVKLLEDLSTQEWQDVLSLAGRKSGEISAIIAQKTNIDMFFGISIVDNPGFAWPAIIVPILAAFTSFLQSYILQKQNPMTDMGDNPAASMTKSMTYMMPIMMGYIALKTPAGLGIYWTIGNIVTIVTQFIIKKYMTNDPIEGVK